MKNNTLYVGGGMRPLLVLSLLPIIDGFAKDKIFKQLFLKKIQASILIQMFFIKV